MNHWIVRSLAVAAFCSPILLRAVQFSGSVRAADQLVPGATVTAINGGAKVTAFTDENGRFTMDLIPGVWDIQVEMFEFTPVKGQVSVGVERISKDYVLTMPKVAQRDGAAAAVTTTTVRAIPRVAARRPMLQVGAAGQTAEAHPARHNPVFRARKYAPHPRASARRP